MVVYAVKLDQVVGHMDRRSFVFAMISLSKNMSVKNLGNIFPWRISLSLTILLWGIHFHSCIFDHPPAFIFVCPVVT